MERKLLLLGLLRDHPMYGYRMNELIDAHLASSVQLTKPTAYRFLNQMAELGWINFSEEREGNRPTRRVYAITPEGETEFFRILRESLASFEPPPFHGTIGLAFMDSLPPVESVTLLGQRRAVIEKKLAALRVDASHHGSFSLVLDHQARHLQTELAWLDEVIDQLETS